MEKKDTELVGCPICKGKKKLLGLGNFAIDCHQCNGIGWIESVPGTAEDEFLATNEIPISTELVDGCVSDDPVVALAERATYQEIDQPKKKSGRPKKAS